MNDIAWSQGRWTNEPAGVSHEGDGLAVEAKEGSDAWRETSYGFVHDTEHALVVAFPKESAMEVDVTARYAEQFDQAGLFLVADEQHWAKCGLELSDGVLQLGAVVTWPKSDWSVAPVPDWNSRTVTVRLSRSGDAVTVRARPEGGQWQFVRVFPVPPETELEAGPLICAPTRAGFTARFSNWRIVEADSSLH